ncbi:MAG: type IV secretion system protein [Treponema sp.]|jgi:type IV secretion system protein VirB5|nr:type IV secretion system protein [Treponema sp.]
MSIHKNPVYKPVDAPNPFLDGSDKAYAEILLDKTKEADVWRKSSYVHIALFAVSLILFFVAISRQQTIPVLVNVMPSGESQYLGEVRQNGSFNVPEAAIHYQIRSFIHNLRSISTDYQVLYSNIDDCFQMVTSAYAPIMRNMLLASSPFDLVGKQRRSVDIESVLHVTGRSYQINWMETVIENQGSTKNFKMRAVVTIHLVLPTDATIKRNPLGIYIENFEMTELK